VNSRLDSIQTAVLNAKLPLLDEYNKARQKMQLENIRQHLKVIKILSFDL
jgi:dTDP-4-amino-4,6-dideoxygalactose transaminase